MVAPLIPVAGVAVAYGPASDPSYEAVLASPYAMVRLVSAADLSVLVTSVPLVVGAGLLLPDVHRSSPWPGCCPPPASSRSFSRPATGSTPRHAAAAVGVAWVAPCPGRFASATRRRPRARGAGRLCRSPRGCDPRAALPPARLDSVLAPSMTSIAPTETGARPCPHRPCSSAGAGKSYRGTTALAGIDLDLYQGVVGLLGPNGAGKTTLLRMLATVLGADRGSVRILGRDPAVGAQRTDIRRRLGYLPQELGYPRGFTAYGFVDYMAVLKEWDEPATAASRGAPGARTGRPVRPGDQADPRAVRRAAPPGRAGPGAARLSGAARARRADQRARPGAACLAAARARRGRPGRHGRRRHPPDRGRRGTVRARRRSRRRRRALRRSGARPGATAVGRVWLADEADPRARTSWRTGTGRYRNLGRQRAGRTHRGRTVARGRLPAAARSGFQVRRFRHDHARRARRRHAADVPRSGRSPASRPSAMPSTRCSSSAPFCATMFSAGEYGPEELDYHVIPSFFIGVLGIVVAARLTASTERSAQLVDAAPVRRPRGPRRCAWPAPSLRSPVSPSSLMHRLFVIAANRSRRCCTAPTDRLDRFVISVIVPVIACAGGPLLGVAVGRWLRFPGAALLAVIAVLFWSNITAYGPAQMRRCCRAAWTARRCSPGCCTWSRRTPRSSAATVTASTPPRS